MCRGGGGNKIRLCTKGGKSIICIALFFPLISENILSFPHVVFFLAFLIPAIQKHVRKWQIRGAVAPRKRPTWRDPTAARAARDPRLAASSTRPILSPAIPPENSPAIRKVTLHCLKMPLVCPLLPYFSLGLFQGLSVSSYSFTTWLFLSSPRSAVTL